MSGHDRCHETVDPETREEMLEKYNHRCQGCGRWGPGGGGVATLHVHHLTRDPPEMDEHHPANLTVFCEVCHSWLHHRATRDDVPIRLTEADLAELLSHDIEMLQQIADEGPMRTGEIAEALSVDLSLMAVRERLWNLMGLDSIVAEREQQIVGRDADTGKWGLCGEIETPLRGRIPTEPQRVAQRVLDEQVRQALAAGCDRSTVADVVGVSPRTTYIMSKRAHAYDIPLDALSGPSRDTPTE